MGVIEECEHKSLWFNLATLIIQICIVEYNTPNFYILRESLVKKYLLRVVILMSFSYTAQAMDCNITYNLKGWSAFYRTATGSGVLSCSNGQSANVKLNLKGGGFTVGVIDITAGKGKIFGVKNINDVFGGHFAMGVHAGFVKSVEARLVPHKTGALRMHGKGTGYNLGFDLGALKINR